MKHTFILASIALAGLLLFSACKKKTEPIIQTDTGADKEFVATRSVNHVDWSKNAVIYEVNIRQYTKEGTFKAFAKHLPRLKKLGVNILWLMPINPISEKNKKGELGSYYAVKDYKKVNPNFGTEADFRVIIEKAHELGMYVILDWVPNHTGWDNVWITEHPDWYTHNDKGEIIPPNPDWSDVADLNYDNKEMRTAMIDALQYWVKEFDVDGYRCDVAGSVPTDFWNDARKDLDKIKPVFMLAEAWEPQLSEDAFDMVYAWDMHHTMNAVAQGKKKPDALFTNIKKDKKRYAPDTYIMQFTSNHDENSWNGTEYERMGSAVKTFATFSFVMPGMPLIYSGQEAGLKKRLEFFKKDEINWNDLSMQDFYEKLTKLKHETKVLWNGTSGGDFQPIATDNDKVVAFSRTKGDDKVIAVFNFSDKEQSFTLKDESLKGKYTEYFSGNSVDLKVPMTVKLPAWAYQVCTAK